MDATLKALADLLLQAVPTIVFFVFLTFFLKYTYFRPMARVLEERRKQTEGVRDLAQRAFDAADKRQGELERALELARADIQKETDALRRQWTDEQTAAIAQTRETVESQIEAAKEQIRQESEQAQAELDAKVEALSEQIVRSLVERRAA
jgi:F0F1-type ATP synthase membrane subunit b/b'